jgi:DmsE family decaheme c-type cytochrome
MAASVMFAVIVVSCTTYNSFRELPAGTPGAVLVGLNDCASCHDDIMQDFRFTPHGSMHDPRGESCEACHGAGSLHKESGGEPDLIVMPNDANCLSCHGASRVSLQGDKNAMMDWHFASHKQAGVNCTDCHNPHSHSKKGLRAQPAFQVQNIDATSSLCLSCHQDIMGRISMPYHHPIREGAMGCTSCHDPHGNSSRRLLSKTETCTQCHQAQQGLFVREHPPVAEDCSICHNPHGSPVPKMLNVGQPMLCLQCHSLTDNRHRNLFPAVSPAALRDCASCHGSVHGSDIDAYFRH